VVFCFGAHLSGLPRSGLAPRHFSVSRKRMAATLLAAKVKCVVGRLRPTVIRKHLFLYYPKRVVIFVWSPPYRAATKWRAPRHFSVSRKRMATILLAAKVKCVVGRLRPTVIRKHLFFVPPKTGGLFAFFCHPERQRLWAKLQTYCEGSPTSNLHRLRLLQVAHLFFGIILYGFPPAKACICKRLPHGDSSQRRYSLREGFLRLRMTQRGGDFCG